MAQRGRARPPDAFLNFSALTRRGKSRPSRLDGKQRPAPRAAVFRSDVICDLGLSRFHPAITAGQEICLPGLPIAVALAMHYGRRRRIPASDYKVVQVISLPW
jgi:hypothetical protein